MTKPLNHLERLGWAVLAKERLLISSGCARMLAALVLDGAGRTVPFETLQSCLAGHDDAFGPINRRMPTQMAKVRNALRQVGLSGDTIEADPLVGYRVSKPAADRVRAFIEADLFAVAA